MPLSPAGHGGVRGLQGPRDPAWLGRVFAVVAIIVVLWPVLVLAEFKPWILFSPESLKPTLRFLGILCRLS